MSKRVENAKALLPLDAAGVQVPQDFTEAWVDLGPIIPVQYSDYAVLRLGLEYSDSSDVRCRIKEYANVTESVTGTAFIPQIESIAASSVLVEDQFVEFNTDVDKNSIVRFDISGMKSVQYQVQAGTLGASGGAVVEAYHNLVRSC